MKTRWNAAATRLGITSASPARITKASAALEVESRRDQTARAALGLSPLP